METLNRTTTSITVTQLNDMYKKNQDKLLEQIMFELMLLVTAVVLQ